MKIKFKHWIGKKLIALRIKNSKEDFEVANYLGMQRNTYVAYENERSEPSALTIIKLCELYQITPDQFFADCPH